MQNLTGEDYALLGLTINASLKDVESVCRRKLFEFHPDRNKSENASSMFVRINNICEKLKLKHANISVSTRNPSSQSSRTSSDPDLVTIPISHSSNPYIMPIKSAIFFGWHHNKPMLLATIEIDKIKNNPDAMNEIAYIFSYKISQLFNKIRRNPIQTDIIEFLALIDLDIDLGLDIELGLDFSHEIFTNLNIHSKNDLKNYVQTIASRMNKKYNKYNKYKNKYLMIKNKYLI